MTFGVCTAIYDGYGKYISQWLESLAIQTRKPDQVIIVAAGNKHGLDHKQLPDWVTVVYCSMRSDGDLRTLAVNALKTDWVVYFDADDVFLENAFETYEKFLEKNPNTDMIASAWVQKEEGRRQYVRQCALPEQIAEVGKGFFCGHSPFRKSAWERNCWPDNTYFPVMYFLANMVEDGKIVRRLKEPTWVYLKRKQGRDYVLPPEKKRDAVKIEREAFARIIKYYGR